MTIHAGPYIQSKIESAESRAKHFHASAAKHTLEAKEYAFRAAEAHREAAWWRAGTDLHQRDLVSVLRDVVAAARAMPRTAPKPGGASTSHTYTIKAANVWLLDRALIALDEFEAATALAEGKSL